MFLDSLAHSSFARVISEFGYLFIVQLGPCTTNILFSWPFRLFSVMLPSGWTLPPSVAFLYYCSLIDYLDKEEVPYCSYFQKEFIKSSTVKDHFKLPQLIWLCLSFQHSLKGTHVIRSLSCIITIFHRGNCLSPIKMPSSWLCSSCVVLLSTADRVYQIIYYYGLFWAILLPANLVVLIVFG